MIHAMERLLLIPGTMTETFVRRNWKKVGWEGSRPLKGSSWIFLIAIIFIEYFIASLSAFIYFYVARETFLLRSFIRTFGHLVQFD